MEEYPLYPELPEEAKKEAQALIDDFKKQIADVAKEVIGKFYCDVATYIETDSWTNFRNEIMDGMKDYNNRKIQGAHDFKEIRQAILKHHRADIIADLNQDMVSEIDSLKERITMLQEYRR